VLKAERQACLFNQVGLLFFLWGYIPKETEAGRAFLKRVESRLIR
jgi:hypothetical protein